MSDIIRVLPDNIANQIAAGEVIQRPASAIKELMENSVDAGANQIHVHLTDSGKALIRVTDNGKGMSETDARLSFERHATSKISNADDLYALTTFGFRGEALASIASVAQVELKTKRAEDTLGTFIEIHGSEFIRQEPVSIPNGTTFSIRNLFYNVPARRKFLKSEQIELSKIIEEFQHVALSYPEVAMSLTNNGKDIYNLPASNLKSRIVNVMGKSIANELLPIHVDTSVVKIEGFIGRPESAKKASGMQYFFVNQRFFKHPFYYRMVLNAYQTLMPNDFKPLYFIYLTIPAESIDVNIHPTKTEIKFENETIISRFISSCVRETLGKTNMIPSIDFDSEASFLDIAPRPSNAPIVAPEISVNPKFNPFYETDNSSKSFSFSQTSQKPTKEWEKLYENLDFEIEPKQIQLESLNPLDSISSTKSSFYQIKGKYFITNFKTGIIIIDQRRAHQRILYDDFQQKMELHVPVSEKQLFPATIQLSPEDSVLLSEHLTVLQNMGFEINEFGKNTFAFQGFPAELKGLNPNEFITDFITNIKETGQVKNSNFDLVLNSLAVSASMLYGKNLDQSEMQYLFDRLFACPNPSFTPSGKKVFTIMSLDEMDKLFK